MSTQIDIASREEVEAFLAATRFDGYQAVPLPHGLSVPGRERGDRAEQVFAQGVAGRSVLDIGTNYGVFPFEAVRRGASRAVGIELDPERAAVAARIAALHGHPYEIREGRVEELEPHERFDVVLLLNVLHHVLDPVEVMRRLVALCTDTMIVEFCLPDDPEYLVHLIDDTTPPRALSWRRARLRSRVLRLALGDAPIMAVGNLPYHRTFYFSPAAFRNLFVTHHRFFSEVRFEPSVTGQRRMLAFCRVRQEAP